VDDIDEAMPAAQDERIPLRGEMTVSAAAFVLTLRLERNGHRLSAADGVLRVSDGARLSDDDRAQIRAHKADLLAVVQYLADLP
jgi:hypothetical protein